MTLQAANQCEGCGGPVGAVASRGSGFCRGCYKKQHKLSDRGLPRFDKFSDCTDCGDRITARASGVCGACWKSRYFSNPENKIKAISRRKSWSAANKGRAAERQRQYFLRPEKRFDRYMTDAARRGYRFELTLGQFVEITAKGCAYCGETGPKTGLDRVDTNGNYEISNVVGCCWPCNKIKCDLLNFEEMRAAMAAVLKIRNKSRCL